MKKTDLKKKELKKPRAWVYLGYPLYDEVERAAAAEPVRALSAFVTEVFKYGWQAYLRVGSLKELKRMQTTGETNLPYPRRVSRETSEQLVIALHTILDRAPSAVIEKIANELTRLAGQFGDDVGRKPRT